MRAQHEQYMRKLSLAVATGALLLSLATAYLLQYLPNDALHIRRNFTLYSLFVACASVAGMLGAIKRSPTLLSLFASHLILDSILYLIPRVILLHFSTSLFAVLCTEFPFSARDDAVYRTSRPPRAAQSMFRGANCQIASWILESCVALIALLFMGLQLWSALKIRRYSQYLERQEILKIAYWETLRGDQEKQSYSGGD